MHFKRGSLYLMIAWAVALLTGYFYNFWLTHRFTQAEYGDYQVVMSVLVWLEIFVINGLPYTIQKFIGSDFQQSGSILRTAVKLQLWAAGFLFLLAVLFAPQIARLFGRNDYTFLMRIAFIDILFAGYYHMLLAYQNGRQSFGRQAFMIMFYALGKLSVGIVLVLLFKTIIYALVANIAASVLTIFWGLFLLGRLREKTFYPALPLIRFTVASLGFLLLLNLIFSIDLWFVGSRFQSEVTGYYGLAGMLARAPYFLFIGVSATMLPTLAAALSAGDTIRVRHLFRQALQFLWMLLAPVGVLMAVFRNDIIATLFKPEYAPAAPVMAVLVWGMIALAFFYLNTTLINADHRPRLSLLLVGGTVGLDVILNAILIPKYSVMGGALSTTVSCMLGLGVSSVFVSRRFRVTMPGKSFLRISGVAAGIGLLSMLSGVQGKWVIPLMFLAMGVYLAILFWMGELSRDDIRDIFGSQPSD